MSDTDNEKPKLGARAPLGLKRTVETGKVKQSFSHGRSNTVVVEVKRRRVLGKPGEAEAAPAPTAAPAPAPAPTPAPAPKAAAPRPADSQLSRRELQEKLLREAEEARMAALEEARRREDREKAEAAEDERRRAEENKREAEAAPAPAETPAVEPEPAAAAPAQPQGVALDESLPAPRRFTPVPRPERPAPPPRRPVTTEAPARTEPPARPSRDRKERDDRRQSGKLTVNRALGDDEGARARSLAALKRAREKERRSHGGGGPREPQAKQVRDVVVPETITVQELASRMSERATDVILMLMKQGQLLKANDVIDADMAQLIAED
ncbi:MAG: translation initiation factor IF-2 associated domain-containing protein, partial [Sphingomonas sp.]